MTFVVRIVATLFFVGLNGFFVAAEFAFVKVRATRLATLAAEGSGSARVAKKISQRLDHYLSACQLGITLASLILGWLAEPAIAELLLAGVAALGGSLSPDDPIVHGAALVIALTVITGLHMIFGEQAPKMFALQRSETTALFVSYPLRAYEILFRPFIWTVNELSNRVFRLLGLATDEYGDNIHDVSELTNIVNVRSPRRADFHASVPARP